MANNTLSTDLQVNDRDGLRKINDFYKRLEEINRATNNFGAGDFAKNFTDRLKTVENAAEKTRQKLAGITRFDTRNNSLDGLSRAAIRLENETQKAAARLRDIQAVDTKGKGASFIKIIADDARDAERQLERLNRQADRLGQRRTARTPTAITPTGGGFGGSIAGAAAGLTFGAAFAAGKELTDVAKEADNANRILRASAVETGIAYDELKRQAGEFGKENSLAAREAEKTFAQIVNFANAAGRSDKLEEFRKRFADLAAAKGINADQLGDISRQLNALTDEATDKLLNANPSAFYDKFAQSIGKTAGQLNDAEKRAAIFDEVLKKGAIFDGEAEKKLKGFAGDVEVLALRFDNAKASISEAIKPLVSFLKFASDVAIANPALFKGDAEKEAAGNNERIAAEARAKEIAESLRTTDKEIQEALKKPFANRRNLALSRVDLVKTFFSDVERGKAIAEGEKFADEFATNFAKQMERGLAAAGDSVDFLKLIRKDFEKQKGILTPEEREKFTKQLAAAISQGAANGFRDSIEAAAGNVKKLREIFTKVSASNDLDSKTQSGLQKDLGKQIEDIIKSAKEKIQSFATETRNLFDNLFLQSGAGNPFVKVFSDAQKAIEETRKATKGLSEDLQKTALDFVRSNNAANLFSARLETGLSALELRDRAKELRGFNNRQTPFDIDNFVKSVLSRTQQSGTFDNLSADQKRDIFERTAIGNNLAFGGGLNQDSMISFLASERLRARRDPGSDTSGSIAERLQRQIDLINRLNPASDAEKAIADKKIIALTNAIDPAQLTDNLRNAAAAANEREAARLETAEAAAVENRTARLDTQKSIDESMKKLVKIAESDGLTGVVRIIDDTSDGVGIDTAKRPTANDTRQLQE